MLCGVLAGVLLLGLGLNAAFGWWWADAVAALVVAAFAVREGWEAWEEAPEDKDQSPG
jgi:divalent metal cation (Fe/Co/Zn/Cd) transporter